MHHKTGIQPSFCQKKQQQQLSQPKRLVRKFKINRLTCRDAVNKSFCSSFKKQQTCSQQQSLRWLGDDLTILQQLSVSGRSARPHTICHQFLEFQDWRNCCNIWNPKQQICVWHFFLLVCFMDGVSSLGEKKRCYIIFATWKPMIWSWSDVCTWFIDDSEEGCCRNLNPSVFK